MPLDPDERISAVVAREGSRLRAFIRRRVPRVEDAEDVLQDVFSELVEANRLLMPIEHLTGWLFQVARNRIVDRWRRKELSGAGGPSGGEHDDDRPLRWEDLLPSAEPGPDARYDQGVLLDVLVAAVDDLPEDQREVFVGHELEGRSFKEMAAETGLSVNTLLSRKRYAVRRLRERLQAVHGTFRRG